jgi:tRNA threonylcarbamoyladenosine biosynthesis protein TsaE
MQQISSTSSEETEAYANKLGKRLKGGEAIELVSDLGGGKTTFVRGLAAGMGSSERVASPTFTLGREYRGKGLTIYHFDFYRLSEAGIMGHELDEALNDPLGIVVIEWADVARGILPERRLAIEIKVTGENSRELRLTYPDTLGYLVEGIK